MIETKSPRRHDGTLHASDRRDFLRLAAAGGAASLVAACGWDGGNAVRPKLLSLSRLNDWVGEKILFSPTRLARTYSPPSAAACCPAISFRT